MQLGGLLVVSSFSRIVMQLYDQSPAVRFRPRCYGHQQVSVLATIFTLNGIHGYLPIHFLV